MGDEKTEMVSTPSSASESEEQTIKLGKITLKYKQIHGHDHFNIYINGLYLGDVWAFNNPDTPTNIHISARTEYKGFENEIKISDITIYTEDHMIRDSVKNKDGDKSHYYTLKKIY